MSTLDPHTQTPPNAGGSDAEQRGEISLLRFLNVLLSHVWLVVGTPLLLALVVGVVLLVLPREYTASTAFLEQSQDSNLSGLSGLAAQFGFALPQASGHSPEFYEGLVMSRTILEPTVETEFEVVTDSGADTLSGNLVELLNAKGSHPAARVADAVERLRRRSSARADRETAVVRVEVTMRSPELANAIVGRILELVEDFNVTIRNSQAREQRTFIEGQLAVSEREVREAEDRLEEFLQRNRSHETSPELLFRHDRLQRIVVFKQAVYGSLAQSFEQARIDEVRNTPVLTMVLAPQVPPRPDRRRIILKVALALAIGLMLGVFLSFGLELLRGMREENPAEYQRFVATRDGARNRVKRVFSRSQG